MERTYSELSAKYNGAGYKTNSFDKDMANAEGSKKIKGLNTSRVMKILLQSAGEGLEHKDIEKLFDKLMAPHKASVDLKDAVEVARVDQEYKSGLKDLKEIYYAQLKRLEATYGTMITQMHPEDFLRQAPENVRDHFSIIS